MFGGKRWIDSRCGRLLVDGWGQGDGGGTLFLVLGKLQRLNRKYRDREAQEKEKKYRVVVGCWLVGLADGGSNSSSSCNSGQREPSVPKRRVELAGQCWRSRAECAACYGGVNIKASKKGRGGSLEGTSEFRAGGPWCSGTMDGVEAKAKIK